MASFTLQELASRIDRLRAEGAALRAEQRQIHDRREALFAWSRRLHFTPPMFFDKPLPESPQLDDR